MQKTLYALTYREQLLPVYCDDSFFVLPEEERKEIIVNQVKNNLAEEFERICGSIVDTFWHYSGCESKVELWGADGIIDITFTEISHINEQI